MEVEMRGGTPPLFFVSADSKGDKVVCFLADSQVLILKRFRPAGRERLIVLQEGRVSSMTIDFTTGVRCR